MRKVLLLQLSLLVGFVSFSQNNFSFSCSKDTSISCSQNCITLQAFIPNIRSSTTSYTVNGICFNLPVDPAEPGNPTDLVEDDYYSAPLDLTFDFPFYGNVYSKVIAVSNGMLSFDISRAGTLSHWEILRDGSSLSSTNGTPENLPSLLYDRALIMGPYHDLDPSVPGTPLSTQIKYDVVGTAPFRKWILSYNTVPLFGVQTGCSNLFQNTHQIILYESLGIVEVNVLTKQICTNWNQGRAMIGLQNFNKNAAIMAPGRAASDNPWGSVGMNESWRFVPAAGPTLFKKVELIDFSGNVVSVGDTVSAGNGIFKVSFPDVCPTATTAYIVKSTYRKFDDASIEIYAMDTINVIRTSIGFIVNASVANAPCLAGGSGTITVTSPVGAAYKYSINGGVSSQSSPVFNVASGNYTVTVTNTATGCVAAIDVTVNSNSTLTASATVVDAACVGSSSGSITVNASLGTPGYTYSVDGNPFQASNAFNNLTAGTYAIEVKDNVGCVFNLPVTVNGGVGISAKPIITNASCAGSSSGSIALLTANGVAPYKYSINGNAPQLSNIFNTLAGGSYTITVSDANNCSVSLTAIVGNDPGVIASATIANAACENAVNGKIFVTPTLGLAPFTYSINGGMFQLSDTFQNLSAGPYEIIVKDAGNCTASLQVVVRNDPGIIATSAIVNASCASVPNGSITVMVNAGIAPFRYSLNGGAFQPANVFTGLFANIYTIDIIDSANCTLRIADTIGNDPKVVATLSAISPSCNGLADGRITITASLGIAPYQYSLNGGPYQAGNVFNNVIAGNQLVHIRDSNNCILDTSILITEPSLLTVATVSTLNSTCTGNADGRITVGANGGSSPYLYTRDITGVTGYQSLPVFPVVAGNYTITVKDANGCKTLTTATIALADTMRLNAGRDTFVCVGSSITLQPQTNDQTTVFNWTPSTGLSSAAVKNPVASPGDTTTYILLAKWGICMRTDSINLNVLHKPLALAGNDTAICFRTFALLHGSSGNVSGPVSYSWLPARGIIKADTANTVARPDTTFLYTLTVKDNYGCNFSVTDDILITQQPPVPAFAGNDTNAVYGTPHQLRASGGVLYSWSPAGPVTNPFSANPQATLFQDTKFVVTVTDNAGCIGTDTLLVKVYKGPTYYIPKAFSPDGDGLNDVFRPIPVGISSTDYFRIYNRYGQALFETSRWMAGWDGTFQGKKQPFGAYVWVIKGKDRNGRIVEMKGTVMLVR